MYEISGGVSYISCLNVELHIITKLEPARNILCLRKVEENLIHHISALNEAVRVLDGAHNTLVLDWLSRVLQAHMSSCQVARPDTQMQTFKKIMSAQFSQSHLSSSGINGL